MLPLRLLKEEDERNVRESKIYILTGVSLNQPSTPFLEFLSLSHRTVMPTAPEQKSSSKSL